MRLSKLLTLISISTIIALLYVHQQVELVKLSYAIEYKEKRLKDALDQRERLEYNIDNLEAPSRLEQALLSRKIDIAFPKRSQVVKLASLQHSYRGEGRLNSVGIEKRSKILGIFEFFIPKAEAQTKEK